MYLRLKPVVSYCISLMRIAVLMHVTSTLHDHNVPDLGLSLGMEGCEALLKTLAEHRKCCYKQNCTVKITQSDSF